MLDTAWNGKGYSPTHLEGTGCVNYGIENKTLLETVLHLEN